MNTRPPCRALTSSLLIFIALVAPRARADQPAAPKLDPAKLAAIPERIRPFVESNEISGAVTCVATRDGVAHLDAVGKADLAGDKPMRPDTVFWIASMTKPITATAVLMMQDEGKLSVDDPVGKFIPELAGLKTADGKPARITLRHLLTHTAGMGEASHEQQKAARKLADLVPVYAAQKVAFEPGSRWAYSQSGINTLARVVEIVSGQDFPAFLDERLFKPLGMTDTTFYPSADQVARLATSYKRTDAGELDPATIFIFAGQDLSSRDRVPLPNGGLFSTASDYAKFCRMILNDGSADGRQYLKPETVKLMTTRATGDAIQTGFTPGMGWGLGWIVVREPQGVSESLSPGSFGHGGAYGTQAWIDPKRGIAYVLMVQRSNFPNADNSDIRKAFQAAAAGASGD